MKKNLPPDRRVKRKTHHWLLATVVGFSAVLVTGIFFFWRTSPTVILDVVAQRGCENPAIQKLRIHIASHAQRYDQVDESGNTISSIVSNFNKDESWLIDHRKKRALLLQDPSQIMGDRKMGGGTPKWNFLDRVKSTCLAERPCEELRFDGPEGQLALKVLAPEKNEKVWFQSQQRDFRETPELGILLDKFAPDRVLVSLQKSRDCESSTVVGTSLAQLESDFFAVPDHYQKNFYMDLHRLPAEVRESILKHQKTQILEAKPENPVLARPDVEKDGR